MASSRLLVVAASYLAALAVAACTEAPTQLIVDDGKLTPRFNYPNESIVCTQARIIDADMRMLDPSDTIRVGNRFDDNWLQDGTFYNHGNGSWSWTGVMCRAEWQPEGVEFCRYNPFHSGCQPTMPIADDGEYDVGYPGGGGGPGWIGPSIPPFTLAVSDCHYKRYLDTAGNYVRDSLRNCQRPFDSIEIDSLAAYRRFKADTADTSHFGLDSANDIVSQAQVDSAKRQCADMFHFLNTMIEDVRTRGELSDWGVGRTDSGSHGGQSEYGQGVGHIDPWRFKEIETAPANQKDIKKKELLRTALHEVAHAYIAAPHPDKDSKGNVLVEPNYTQPYFRWLNFIDGSRKNQCVR